MRSCAAHSARAGGRPRARRTASLKNGELSPLPGRCSALAPAAAVQLMNLTQSTLLHCDALILAGANAEHLPGSGVSSLFFNVAVRRDLGLPTARARYAQRSYAFRRLLECAPEIVITLQHEQNGEARLPSPWVEAISRFLGLAYGNDLAGADLAALISRPEAQVLRADTAELPAPQPRPAPSISAYFLRVKLSAGAYLYLIYCLYLFFAARCLRLCAHGPRRALAQTT